jgi:general secretion pathway protein E
MATPITDRPKPPAPRDAEPELGAGDRRLRLDDILTQLVADGLVTQADADHVARARTRRFEHPLELVADHKLRSQKPPSRVLVLETLVEWLAGKLGVPYVHIDPLSIDLGAVTATMSNAYCQSQSTMCTTCWSFASRCPWRPSSTSCSKFRASAKSPRELSCARFIERARLKNSPM